MEVDQITGNGGGGATAEKPQSLQISAPIIAKVEDTTVFQCEQCNKPFSTVILLKYHYCSHFMNLMKKNYGHLLDSKKSVWHFLHFPPASATIQKNLDGPDRE